MNTVYICPICGKVVRAIDWDEHWDESWCENCKREVVPLATPQGRTGKGGGKE